MGICIERNMGIWNSVLKQIMCTRILKLLEYNLLYLINNAVNTLFELIVLSEVCYIKKMFLKLNCVFNLPYVLFFLLFLGAFLLKKKLKDANEVIKNSAFQLN